MESKNEEKTILQLMEILSEKSNDSKLGEEFWAENGAEAAELANRLALTPKQAVLLSICLRRGPRRVEFSDIASHLDISNIRALGYSDDVNALIRAKYLSEEQCASLASAYDLSGGQMENVARKFSINSILYGGEKSPMDILHAYCDAERLDNQTTRRIGF